MPRLEPLRQTRLDPLLTPDPALTVRRLQADADQEWTSAATFQARVLYVAAGALTVTVDPTSPAPAVLVATSEGQDQGRPVPPGTQARVDVGEALALSPVVRYRLHAAATQPALQAYEIAFPRESSTGPAWFPDLARAPIIDLPPPSPLRSALLAEAAHPDLPQVPLRVAWGRILLPPGSSLAFGAAPGPQALLVEAGALGLTVPQADADLATTMVEPGAATLVPGGATSTLQAVGAAPVVVVIVTLRLPSDRGGQ